MLPPPPKCCHTLNYFVFLFRFNSDLAYQNITRKRRVRQLT